MATPRVTYAFVSRMAGYSYSATSQTFFDGTTELWLTVGETSEWSFSNADGLLCDADVRAELVALGESDIYEGGSFKGAKFDPSWLSWDGGHGVKVQDEPGDPPPA